MLYIHTHTHSLRHILHLLDKSTAGEIFLREKVALYAGVVVNANAASSVYEATFNLSRKFLADHELFHPATQKHATYRAFSSSFSLTHCARARAFDIIKFNALCETNTGGSINQIEYMHLLYMCVCECVRG